MNLIHHTPTLTEYPYSLWRLRKDNPNVSFSDNPTAADIAPFNAYWVTLTPQPQVDLRTHRVEEAPLPTRRNDGSWAQAWVVRDATPEEKAEWEAANPPPSDWTSFAVELAMSPAIAALYAAIPDPVSDGLSVGLSKASDGDPEAFLKFWSKLVAAGAITPELLSAIVALGKQFKLPQTFIKALSGGK
jgi:hypothetical protein